MSNLQVVRKKNGKPPLVHATEAKLMLAQAELAEARQEISMLNSLTAALITEKFGGRTFVSIPAVIQHAGWAFAFVRLLPLGTVRLTVVDKEGNPQVRDDQDQTQHAIVCEDCGKPAIVAAGKDAAGKILAPKCADHIPVGATVSGDSAVEVVPEAPTACCSDCGRKVGHNRDCLRFNEN